MNTANALRHLNEQELLKAIVDSADLGQERQAHLAGCPSCLQARATIENRLAHLGRQAQVLAPLPARVFRLPDQQPAAASRRFRPAWAMGLMAVVLLAFAVGGPIWFHSPATAPAGAKQAAADMRFMEDVDALVADALPVPYQELTAMDWPMLRIERPDDEALIDWVVPSLDDDDYLT